MTDIFNKILGVLLAFALLVGAPLIINTMSKDVTMNRSVLNEITNFIDKVCDNGRITEQDLTDFYLGISSYGMPMDATIQRYMKIVNPTGGADPNGNYDTQYSYVLNDDITKWNAGDIIKVTVEAIDYTSAQRIQNRILHLTPSKFKQTLAGMVRN